MSLTDLSYDENRMDFQDDELKQFETGGARMLPSAQAQGFVDNDGACIWYATYGAGAPVVLLHGGLGHSGNWGHQVPALLKSGYRAILIDSRGHERSTRDTRPYSYELMASDVLAVMDSLHLERAVLGGWSDGACIALILAARNAERVTSVFFFACNMDPSGVKPKRRQTFRLGVVYVFTISGGSVAEEAQHGSLSLADCPASPGPTGAFETHSGTNSPATDLCPIHRGTIAMSGSATRSEPAKQSASEGSGLPEIRYPEQNLLQLHRKRSCRGNPSDYMTPRNLPAFSHESLSHWVNPVLKCHSRKSCQALTPALNLIFQ